MACQETGPGAGELPHATPALSNLQVRPRGAGIGLCALAADRQTDRATARRTATGEDVK